MYIYIYILYILYIYIYYILYIYIYIYIRALVYAKSTRASQSEYRIKSLYKRLKLIRYGMRANRQRYSIVFAFIQNWIRFTIFVYDCEAGEDYF